MKLLFDQNLSWRLPSRLADIYPDSEHVRNLALSEAEDIMIWNFAGENDFTIVTKDLDFQQRSFLFGHPPKVIRLRLGNCTVQHIEDILRNNSDALRRFIADGKASLIALP